MALAVKHNLGPPLLMILVPETEWSRNNTTKRNGLWRVFRMCEVQWHLYH